MSKFRRLVAGGSIFVVAGILGRVFGLIETIVLTNIFSVADYGRIALGLTIIGITGPILQLGLSSGAKRYIRSYSEENEHQKAYGTAILAIGVAAGLGITVAAVTYFLSGRISTMVFNDPSFRSILVAFTGVVAVKSVLGVLSDTYQGREQFLLSVGFGKPGQAFFRVIVAVIAAVAGLLAGEMITLLAGGFVVLAVVGSTHLLKSLREHASTPNIPVRKLFGFSLPLVFSTISGRVLSDADYILIGIFASSAAVGIYRPAFLLGSSVLIFYQALNRSFYPVYNQVVTADDNDGGVELLGTFLFWSYVLTIPIVVWTVVFAEPILTSFFGPEYGRGRNVLRIISATLLCSVVVGPVGTILEVRERTNAVLKTYVLSMVVNIMLNVLLIPVYGILGAAIGTSISLLVLNLGQYSVAKRVEHFNRNLRKMGKGSLIAIVTVVPAAVLPIPDWVIVPLSVLYFLIVLGLTYAIVPISDSDKALFGPFVSRFR
jgi:O-antigen/teichoic acid export membrane protein